MGASGACPQLSTIVHDCVTKVPLRKGPQKVTKMHKCRRLCANCREWPYAPIWDPHLDVPKVRKVTETGLGERRLGSLVAAESTIPATQHGVHVMPRHVQHGGNAALHVGMVWNVRFSERTLEQQLKSKIQKNPRAHKSKIGTPPLKKTQIPPPPPKTRHFMGEGGFPAERMQFFQAPIKLAQPFLAPELRVKRIRGHEAFPEKWVSPQVLTRSYPNMRQKPSENEELASAVWPKSGTKWFPSKFHLRLAICLSSFCFSVFSLFSFCFSLHCFFFFHFCAKAWGFGRQDHLIFCICHNLSDDFRSMTFPFKKMVYLRSKGKENKS